MKYQAKVFFPILINFILIPSKKALDKISEELKLALNLNYFSKPSC
jgi:hypothetical protein